MSESNQYADVYRHSNRYRCTKCGCDIWVDWWDGGGAVSRAPIVECGDATCDGGRMTLVD